jgi:hypothetical protein
VMSSSVLLCGIGIAGLLPRSRPTNTTKTPAWA